MEPNGWNSSASGGVEIFIEISRLVSNACISTRGVERRLKYFGEGWNKAKFTLLNFAIIGGRDKGQRNLEDYEENNTGSSGFYKFCFIVSLVITKKFYRSVKDLSLLHRRGTRRILNNKEKSIFNRQIRKKVWNENPFALLFPVSFSRFKYIHYIFYDSFFALNRSLAEYYILPDWIEKTFFPSKNTI